MLRAVEVLLTSSGRLLSPSQTGFALVMLAVGGQTLALVAEVQKSVL